MTRLPKHTYRVVRTTAGYAVQHEVKEAGTVRRSVQTWASFSAAFAATFDPKGLAWGKWR